MRLSKYHGSFSIQQIKVGASRIISPTATHFGEDLCASGDLRHVGIFEYQRMHRESLSYSQRCFVSGPPYNFEMGSKLEISPYLFNRHYDSNNPKILAPIPQSVKIA